MAEQVSHNVVNNTESTSDSSPLADVVANHNTAATAGNGDKPLPTPNTIADALDTSKTQNATATDANAATLTEGGGTDAGKAAADPSAGDVAEKPAEVTSIVPPVQTSEEKSNNNLGAQLANGLHDAVAAGELGVEEAAVQDISADPSVTSDTDVSRAEALESNKDGNKHVRTTSVKKPTTFSKVSVSKNFLAKTATAAPTAAKPGDKGKNWIYMSS